MNDATDRAFRFFDNREKYLLFVTTCGEKWAIGERIDAELPRLVPRPPRPAGVRRRDRRRHRDGERSATASRALPHRAFSRRREGKSASRT